MAASQVPVTRYNCGVQEARTEPFNSGTASGAVFGLAPAALIVAPCLLTLCLTSAAPQARGKAAELSADGSTLCYADPTCNDVTAGPNVTSPVAPVARFGICELPLLADLVQVRCVAAVVIARIGGLYGP